MRSVGVLVFPGFELLDVFGPMEMLGHLPDKYALTMVAETVGHVRSNPTLEVVATCAFGDRTDFDILFVPGGPGARHEIGNDKVLDWIRNTSKNAEYVLSVCTGSALLAKAGILKGKRATSNKMAYSWATAQATDVLWQPRARWVEDGNIFTSSGVSAGIDMTLAAIARMHGLEQAETVAMWCEYQWHQDPSWDPFAETHGLV